MKSFEGKKKVLWIPLGLFLGYLVSSMISTRPWNAPIETSEARLPSVTAVIASASSSAPSSKPSFNESSSSSVMPDQVDSLTKEWATFKKLKPKVLKTAQEQEEYYSKLESRELLAAAVRSLEEIPSAEDTKDLEHEHENRAQRLVAIDWMDEALSWKENPQRSEVIEKLTSLVAREVSTLSASDSARETLAGDKIELIGLLVATDPRLAARLEQAATQSRTGSPNGSKDAKLFKYARSMYGLPEARGTN